MFFSLMLLELMFSVTPVLGDLDVVLASSDDLALIDGDLASTASFSSLASSIEVSIVIDASASFVNLTLLLSEVGVLIILFSSFGLHSISMS